MLLKTGIAKIYRKVKNIEKIKHGVKNGKRKDMSKMLWKRIDHLRN